MTRKRDLAKEAFKALALSCWYLIRLDWKFDPVKRRYWPSGRRP